MMTGYAAKVATTGRCWSMVHIFIDRVALCGYKPNKSMSIQWCSNGVRLEYVECKKCKTNFKKDKEK